MGCMYIYMEMCLFTGNIECNDTFTCCFGYKIEMENAFAIGYRFHCGCLAVDFQCSLDLAALNRFECGE